jgi:hypothetical protein
MVRSPPRLELSMHAVASRLAADAEPLPEAAGEPLAVEDDELDEPHAASRRLAEATAATAKPLRRGNFTGVKKLSLLMGTRARTSAPSPR